MTLHARVRAAGSVATWAVLAMAGYSGCDFDKRLEECATAELCIIDAGVPALRFPRNGAGLGSPTATLTQTPYSPVQPYLAWDFDGDDTWHFRVQLHQCGSGQSLDQCPFTTSHSDFQLDAPVTTYRYSSDLQVHSRYWWRVRACDTKQPGTPCGPWSAPRYFDVGRPEAMANDFEGTGRGSLAVAGTDAGNSGKSEKLYLYSGASSVPTLWTEMTVGPPDITGNYLVVVAGAGDLNGDGYSDMAVGYRPNGIVTQAYPVDVYLGGQQGFSAIYTRLRSRSEGFGAALGRAGDVNGDGFSDLVVCQQFQGRALIFFGRRMGVADPMDGGDGDAQLSLPNANLGRARCAFAALADVDSDGFDDIAIAAEGQLLVFRGHEGSGAWTDTVLVPAPFGVTGFGASMAGGDFNGDGHGDLIVAADNAKAYLYLGDPQWFTAGGAISPPIAFDVPVGVITTAGDMNNDGFADLAVGGGSSGKVQLFLGRGDLGPDGGTPRPGPSFQSGLSDFGISFAGVGDVTADFFEDLAVGSTSGVIIYRGAASDGDIGLQTSALVPPTGSVQFGIGVAPGY